MWIYITGCIVAFIALIITHLKYEDILTVGELMSAFRQAMEGGAE